MATGTAGSSNPTSGTAGAVALAEVISPQAWADLMATANACYGTFTGAATARSFKGIVIDGTGGAVVSPTARYVSITGGAGVFESTAGALTVSAGIGDLNLNASPGQIVNINREIKVAGKVQVNESTLSFTTGSSTVIQSSANGTACGYVIQSSVQTTDATVTTIYTFALPTTRAVHIVASVIGMETDATNGAAYYVSDQFRNEAGTVTRIGAAVTLASQESAGAAAWGLSGWAVSGTDLLLQVQGDNATTINWMAMVQVNMTGA